MKSFSIYYISGSSFKRGYKGMEARRTKMIQARASFREQGSLKLISKEQKMKSKDEEKPENRNIFLIFRWGVAIFLFILYIYGVEGKSEKMNELSRKSSKEIQKNEKYIEKCSAFFGDMW